MLIFIHEMRYRSKLICSTGKYPVFPALFVEETMFFPYEQFGSLVRNQLRPQVQGYFWTLVHSG